MKTIKKDGRDVEGGRCVRDTNRKLGCTEDDKKRIWKEHMEKIMNEENSWDQDTDADMVEGPLEKVNCGKIVNAIKAMKPQKAHGPSGVTTEMISASGQVGVNVMMHLCQRVLDGKGMPQE